MSLSATRAALRQTSQLSSRTALRFNSSTASKASEKATEVKSKAAEGLSRVTSSAGPAISGAAKSVSNALSKIGGRTGRLIAFVERQIPPTIYYARVGLELSKLVFHGQKMAPPPVSTFQAYFQKLVKGFSNPSSLFSQVSKSASKESAPSLLNQVRNINSAQLAAGGVILAETLGFFTVGEMIGRMKIVGYRGDTEHHH